MIAPPYNPIPVGHSSVSMMENLFNLGKEVQQSNQGDADDEGADIDTIVNNEHLPEIPFATSIIRKVLLQRRANCYRLEISTYWKSLRSIEHSTLQQATP
ncbi:unnamed protein product [Clavelina lepadiformis]|uniref:Uncharacterized protein n=1 Tax=Clavelina lepadiformis TaxID=159417 RepID=A0ABP0EZ32_CLALP